MSLWNRIATTMGLSSKDDDIAEELRSHMEMRAADNAADGMADEDARLDAIRRFGNNTQIQEHTRAQHLIVWLETVVQDVRYGLRTLRRSPVFTIVAIATMVLSIGATTAIFTVVESILLRPLPYPDAGQLITIATFMPKQNSEVTASPEYMGWRDHSSTLAGVAAYDVENVNFSGAGDPDRVVAAYTTANFLSVLGISPRLGRMFSSDEDQPGSAHVVVLSHALWQSRFGMAADTIGKRSCWKVSFTRLWESCRKIFASLMLPCSRIFLYRSAYPMWRPVKSNPWRLSTRWAGLNPALPSPRQAQTYRASRNN